MKRDTSRPELFAAGEATRALGAYDAGLRYSDLPPKVAEKAKECVLDALGCCLFGVTRSWTRMLLDMVSEQGVTSAQMSLYFTLAAMAFDGEVLTEQFSEERLADPELLAFMRRIRIEPDGSSARSGPSTRPGTSPRSSRCCGRLLRWRKRYGKAT